MTKREQQLTAALIARKQQIEARIAAAAEAVGRAKDEITIVAVTKEVDPETARAAFHAGFHDLAENRPQQLKQKAEELHDLAIRWHQIGTLQRNKVRPVLSVASLVHAVDSLRLLETVSRIAQETAITAAVLVQVNVSGETSKHGFSAAALQQAWEQLVALPHVAIKGLMTMAPLEASDAECLAYFQETAALRDALQKQSGFALPYLSMGMSEDFEMAVQAGATHVRLGSVLFNDLHI